jgi:CheY-like chemotaxis protein
MPTNSQKVVIVNGNADMLALVDSLLEAGHYDVVFVESTEHAYSQIKRVVPDLVIMCVQIDDVNVFQVLSMLKLDADTRDIPVVTYASGCDGEEAEDDAPEFTVDEMFAPKAAVPMN